MSFTDNKRNEIKRYLLRKVDEDDAAMIGKVSDAFGISATSVKRYVDSELKEKHIIADADKACGYSLVFRKETFSYDIDDITDYEDEVVYEDFLPMFSEYESAQRIWQYVLPEMLNNALEHSGGTTVTVDIWRCCLYTRILMADDGIGIFKKITPELKKYGYRNPRLSDAVAELYKGKFTTCPERHSGEGIFFSMRMLDKMAILSDGLVLRSGYADGSALIRSHLLSYAMKLSKTGTVLIMQLENITKRTAKEVFAQYADPDCGFIRTTIPVFEACLDREPVARSQARRLSHRLDHFREVILDFDKVTILGQGFADEMFRVFSNEHPEVTLTPVNMTEEVERMYLCSRKRS
ncbi:MAG: DUF4325 domain-containing protein [Lachnospiraceae bacterium]|nr:DUF4325 domain-containing protein [Lachnospiraceae bacterium]